MKITVTEVKVETDDFDYAIRYVDSKGWSVTRWPAGKTPIPPRMELLSDQGWVGVIPATDLKAATVFLDNHADAVPYIRNAA